MVLRSVHHIVIRVDDFDKAVATYRDALGMELDYIDEVPDIGVKQALFPLPDGGLFELVAPLTEESPVARALERGGEGVHSLSMEVADLAKTVDELSGRGVPLIGAEDPENNMVFIHPRATHGVLIEIRGPE